VNNADGPREGRGHAGRSAGADDRERGEAARHPRVPGHHVLLRAAGLGRAPRVDLPSLPRGQGSAHRGRDRPGRRPGAGAHRLLHRPAAGRDRRRVRRPVAGRARPVGLPGGLRRARRHGQRGRSRPGGTGGRDLPVLARAAGPGPGGDRDRGRGGTGARADDHRRVRGCRGHGPRGALPRTARRRGGPPAHRRPGRLAGEPLTGGWRRRGGRGRGGPGGRPWWTGGRSTRARR